MGRAVDLYCEDSGHELFVRALIERLAREERTPLEIVTRNGRGGHGRAVSELKAWQRAGLHSRPDLLVLVIDCNSSPWREAHEELLRIVDSSLFPHHVVGCPEPHIERWCFADPDAFREVIGAPPLPDPGVCGRQVYKDLLRRSVLEAGQPILTDAMEIAPDLVEIMDFYKVGKNKNQRSLKLFYEETAHSRSIRTIPTP